MFQELADIGISAVAVGDSRETGENILKGEYKLVFGSTEIWLRKTWINNFKKSALRFSGNFWILKHMFTCALLIQLRQLSRNGFFTDCLYSRDLTFTRLLDSVKYEAETFTVDFVSSFVIKGPLDGIYLWNRALKASCEEFLFVDQGLCKWIL